jgi:hypothetical protein
MRPQISFFATGADLRALLASVELARPVEYVQAGLFESPAPHRMSSLLGDPRLGLSASGDHNHNPSFLVVDRGERVVVRPVPQRRGGVKYAIDQQVNPKSVRIRPSGVFQPNCIIAGDVGTLSEDPKSLGLFELFQKQIRSMFTAVRDNFLGEEALVLLDRGWRLTGNAKARRSTTSPDLDTGIFLKVTHVHFATAVPIPAPVARNAQAVEMLRDRALQNSARAGSADRGQSLSDGSLFGACSTRERRF